MGARVVLSFEDRIVREVELAKPVTVVGRHPDCDLVIEHPAISGRHMLLRVVNRTVYVEDLASTNGTRVNGLSAVHQVVHHLDMIEIGRHKLHFFDDALLAANVSNLETTILTEYERTMLAANVPAALARAAAPEPEEPVLAEAAPAPRRRRDDDDIDRTQFIPRDAALRLGPASETVRTDAPAAAAGPALALRVASGPERGRRLALERANTMIGAPGGDTALVVKRGASYFLARFSGNRPPRLNRRDLGPGTHQIAANDVIEVGGASFEVVSAE